MNELKAANYRIEILEAELDRLREERNEALFVRGELALENERLRSELATCRELREYDAKDKARLRRIEKAVRAYVEKNSGYGHGSGLDPLRAALEEQA